jgi:hypothetical protein
MADKKEIRRQLISALEKANYPLNSPMDLVPHVPPEGTEFSSDDFSITMLELNEIHGRFRRNHSNGPFSYDSAEEYVDDLMKALEKELPEHFGGQDGRDTSSTRVDRQERNTEVYQRDSGSETEVYKKETEIYSEEPHRNPSHSDTSYCPSCGTELDEESSFCRSCGQDVSEL